MHSLQSARVVIDTTETVEPNPTPSLATRAPPGNPKPPLKNLHHRVRYILSQLSHVPPSSTARVSRLHIPCHSSTQSQHLLVTPSDHKSRRCLYPSVVHTELVISVPAFNGGHSISEGLKQIAVLSSLSTRVSTVLICPIGVSVRSETDGRGPEMQVIHSRSRLLALCSSRTQLSER